jgi:hypothetical protein
LEIPTILSVCAFKPDLVEHFVKYRRPPHILLHDPAFSSLLMIQANRSTAAVTPECTAISNH